MSTMQFWLKFNNGAETLRFPVNPPEIRVESGYNWTTINLTQSGEYTIPSGHPLTKISFSSFFPRDYNASYCEYPEIPKPTDCTDKIAKWKETKQPVRLIVTGFGGGKGLNYAMCITEFEFWEQAGSPGDIYFTLGMQEYRFINLTQVGAAASKQTGIKTVVKADNKPSRPNERQLPKTYTVKSGDTLSKIVQRLRTEGVKNLTVDKLYQANKNVIGKNKNLIKPGQVFKVPS
ncbi:LysM peptidoglycan-binding domain-containing protein [Aneurinibacillus aneurinilyticus]|uniref:LysM peptidoglycan-binding domain-containing protein n=1 Tax=Aneurinibacillus aneurinilyticus TaxID=1391 RepID=A0A848D1N5_ANEAE|nr:LysM peptidoglycan-binding domain-containing protein [Aneurinibacillus aneurinilyticus]NME99997.1 LysM peptidoglycan-binding domain-containing protein [Aneurinibacillus aneurinilyticus]